MQLLNSIAKLLLHPHEVEAMILPGIFLVVGTTFIFFYPIFLTWSLTLWVFLVPILAILGIFVGFMLVHPLGSLIEKSIIEKLFNFDLKRIDKIHKIVGKSKAIQLIKKYNPGTDERKWASVIRQIRKKLTGSDKEMQEKYNSHNKLIRGLLTVCVTLFVIGCFKYGLLTILNIWNHSIVLITIGLILLLAWKMRNFEKRELQVIYEAV